MKHKYAQYLLADLEAISQLCPKAIKDFEDDCKIFFTKYFIE